MIRETCALLHGEAERYNISVRMDLAIDLPQISGDCVQLQQIAMDLIVNSIGAMKDVERMRVMIIKSQRYEKGRILVSVSGSDIGLPLHLAGKAHGKSVVADMIGVADKAGRLQELKAFGVSWVELHAGLDEQAQSGYTIDTLLEAGRDASIAFSVAGGINKDRIGAVEAAGATLAVAGAAIYGATDPAASAKLLRAMIQKLG